MSISPSINPLQLTLVVLTALINKGFSSYPYAQLFNGSLISINHIKKIGNDIHDLSSILSEIKYDIIDKNNNIPKSFKLDEYLLIPKYDKSIKKFVRNYF